MVATRHSYYAYYAYTLHKLQLLGAPRRTPSRFTASTSQSRTRRSHTRRAWPSPCRASRDPWSRTPAWGGQLASARLPRPPRPTHAVDNGTSDTSEDLLGLGVALRLAVTRAVLLVAGRVLAVVMPMALDARLGRLVRRRAGDELVAQLGLVLGLDLLGGCQRRACEPRALPGRAGRAGQHTSP